LEGISVADISNPNHEMAGILQDTVTMYGQEKPEPVPEMAIHSIPDTALQCGKERGPYFVVVIWILP